MAQCRKRASKLNNSNKNMNLWRLNVKEAQIISCIRHKKFAIASKPRNPEINKGDYLLLQLVSADANKLGKSKTRIEYALVFDHYEYDHDGTISRRFWPNAEKTWTWIIHCSDITITFPFSLDHLRLNHDYASRTNPMHIRAEDRDKVAPYVLRCGKVTEIGNRVHDALEEAPAQRNYKLWALLQNNDRIVEDSPDQIRWITIPAHKEIRRNPELPFILKEFYKFKCQICGWDFERDYGRPYSETHHVIWLSRGGVDHSNNLIVVCPNHHRIIHEAQPKFDRDKFSFIYPNGLKESLRFTDHLKDPALVQKIELWSLERVRQIENEDTVVSIGEE